MKTMRFISFALWLAVLLIAATVEHTFAARCLTDAVSLNLGTDPTFQPFFRRVSSNGFYVESFLPQLPWECGQTPTFIIEHSFYLKPIKQLFPGVNSVPEYQWCYVRVEKFVPKSEPNQEPRRTEVCGAQKIQKLYLERELFLLKNSPFTTSELSPSLAKGQRTAQEVLNECVEDYAEANKALIQVLEQKLARSQKTSSAVTFPFVAVSPSETSQLTAHRIADLTLQEGALQPSARFKSWDEKTGMEKYPHLQLQYALLTDGKKMEVIATKFTAEHAALPTLTVQGDPAVITDEPKKHDMVILGEKALVIDCTTQPTSAPATQPTTQPTTPKTRH